MITLSVDELAFMRDIRRHRYHGKPTATAAMMRDKMNAFLGTSLTTEDVRDLCHKYDVPAPEPARSSILKL